MVNNCHIALKDSKKLKSFHCLPIKYLLDRLPLLDECLLMKKIMKYIIQ